VKSTGSRKLIEIFEETPGAVWDCEPRAGGFLFFAYAQKTKPFTSPLQNGSAHLGNSPRRINGNICYVSMNHFETATATEQQKGIAQERNPPAHPKGDRDRAHRMLRIGRAAQQS
jgi:hypothetical protein